MLSAASASMTDPHIMPDLSEDKNKKNKKVDCKYESDNYTCETIKNGKLVVERNSSDETNN